MNTMQSRLYAGITEKIERIREPRVRINEEQRLALIDGTLATRFQGSVDQRDHGVKIYAQIGWTTHLELMLTERGYSTGCGMYVTGDVVATALTKATDVRRPDQGNGTATLAGLPLVLFSSPREVLVVVPYNNGARIEAVLTFIDSLLDDAYDKYVGTFGKVDA